MSPAVTLSPGNFCWFELAALDQEAAKKFYQSVFGWSVDDQPMGPTEKYSIFRVDGKDVAAGYTMRAEQRSMGMPPNWAIYVLVADADKVAARAKQLGATIHAEPFDVMDSGRMSVIQDPTGASFCIWQPKKSAGVGLKGEQGTVTWADLSTTDQAKAAKFYGDLFGWKMLGGDNKPAKPGDYVHIVNGHDYIGGIQPPAHRDPAMPSHWLLYFAVNDADATIKKVSSLGGRTIMPMMTMGEARKYAVLADPQGAVFAIVQELGGKETNAMPKAEAKTAPKPAPKPAKPAAKPAPKSAPKPAPKAKPKAAKKPAKKAKPAKRAAPKAAKKSKPTKKAKKATKKSTKKGARKR